MNLLDANDPRPVLEQLADKGWRRNFDVKLDSVTMNLNPTMPPETLPVETYEFRGDTIYLYAGDGVLVMHPNKSWVYGQLRK